MAGIARVRTAGNPGERAPAEEQATRAGRPDTPRIAVMTLAHFVNDSYGQYLAILLPLLAVSLHFSLGLASVVVTAYTITSSIIQPLLGHFADRHTTRLISVLGLVATSIGGSLLGVAPSFVVLILFAVLAGLGTASYHPQAAAMVVAVSAQRKSTMMSIYLVGGSIGFALSPKIVSQVANHNLHATPWLMIPGLLMAAFLALSAPRDWAPSGIRAEMPSLWRVLREHRRVLLLLLGVVVLRSWTQQGLSTFLPFYYKHQGLPHDRAANVLTVFGLTGAFGGLLGGYLADRFSQKPVIVISLVAAGPLLVVLPHLDGAVLYLVAGLAGILLLSSWNVLTVKGQMLLSKNVGMASGLMLGFSIGLGGLGTIPMGYAGDQIGILPLLVFTALLAPVAGLLAIALPD
ncbi:MAG: MFS transporter [Dehalococcoidia bacterium]